jgi:hypothetical protein
MLAASDAELLRWRHELEGWRLTVQLMRRQLARRSYDPNQPRIPRGDSHGGEWAKPGTFGSPPREADASSTIRVAQNDSRYSVDLAEEEARGGHAIRRHVGRSDADLLNAARGSRYALGVMTVARPREGSFSSLETASDLVKSTLDSNHAIVDQVAMGQLREAFVTRQFEFSTGREACRPDVDAAPYLRDTYGVGVYILHDRRSPRGYRVRTAYPRNDD